MFSIAICIWASRARSVYGARSAPQTTNGEGDAKLDSGEGVGRAVRITILGAGNVGSAFARRLAARGHDVTLAFSRDRRKLEATARAVPVGEHTGPGATRSRSDVHAKIQISA